MTHLDVAKLMEESENDDDDDASAKKEEKDTKRGPSDKDVAAYLKVLKRYVKLTRNASIRMFLPVSVVCPEGANAGVVRDMVRKTLKNATVTVVENYLSKTDTQRTDIVIEHRVPQWAIYVLLPGFIVALMSIAFTVAHLCHSIDAGPMLPQSSEMVSWVRIAPFENNIIMQKNYVPINIFPDEIVYTTTECIHVDSSQRGYHRGHRYARYVHIFAGEYERAIVQECDVIGSRMRQSEYLRSDHCGKWRFRPM